MAAYKPKQYYQDCLSKGKSSCDDVLAQFYNTPKELVFVDCKKGYEPLGKALKAKYRVSAYTVKSIEAYLNMTSLIFECCGFSTPARNGCGYFTYRGYPVYVSIYSIDEAEIAISKNDKVPKFYNTVINDVPAFYVEASLLLEQP